ncbi:hypothetical protein QBC35DRAFT_453076 [Podospora australis]|uniref:Uncharacterized protein n=1 Tax=Podospora australis TaxID=1536484 RepID=A0AAN6WRI9_9PEZI|nr:hypothetical protein QBC35DRAFT_453076 [Podospora australis]
MQSFQAFFTAMVSMLMLSSAMAAAFPASTLLTARTPRIYPTPAAYPCRSRGS